MVKILISHYGVLFVNMQQVFHSFWCTLTWTRIGTQNGIVIGWFGGKLDEAILPMYVKYLRIRFPARIKNKLIPLPLISWHNFCNWCKGHIVQIWFIWSLFCSKADLKADFTDIIISSTWKKGKLVLALMEILRWNNIQ